MLETSKKMYSLIVLICRWCGLIVSACRWLEYSPPSGPQPDSTAILPVETLPVVCCCHRLIYSHCIEVNKKWFRVVSNSCWGPELEVSKSEQWSGEVDGRCISSSSARVLHRVRSCVRIGWKDGEPRYTGYRVARSHGNHVTLVKALPTVWSFSSLTGVILSLLQTWAGWHFCTKSRSREVVCLSCRCRSQ